MKIDIGACITYDDLLRFMIKHPEVRSKRDILCPNCHAFIPTPRELDDIPDGFITCPDRKCEMTICPVHEILLSHEDACPACVSYLESFGEERFEKHCKEVYEKLRS